MADLTEQDKKNYEKLQTAFKNLDTIKYSEPSKAVTLSIKTEIAKPLAITDDTNELRRRIDLVDSYLKIHAFLVPPEKLLDIQDILDLNKQIDSSLNAIKNETLNLTDDIEIFQPDSLFITLVEASEASPPATPTATASTVILIDDRAPNLKEEQIDYLTQVWGKAISKFVEDARRKNEKKGSVDPGQPETFAHFFRIHKELEILYGRLAKTEALQSSR